MTRDRSPVVRVAVAHFPPTAAAVPEVRTSTVRTLMAWSLDPAAVEVAELIVCELASNAVKASRPDEVVAVRLTATNGEVLIEVWDGNDTAPRIKHPDVHSEDGRGLLMVDVLSSRWSWHLARTGGKVVWAQFPGKLHPARYTTDDQSPMPTRTTSAVPEPTAPVVYHTDPKTLRRVAAALRELDDWHQLHPAVALAKSDRGREPAR